MGVLHGYFAADGDDDAVRAVVREDGEPPATGHDGFDVNAMDPVVTLVPAEVLITGRPAEAVRADPRHGRLVAMVGEGEVVCLSLTDSLRDALADVDRTSLDGVARKWAASSDVVHPPPDPSGLADFLDRMADLADRAVARGQRRYCWIRI